MTVNVKTTLAALASGMLFGLGLAVSGLTDPDKVLQFLTLSANWSPVLLFTMGAGVAVSLLGYRWVLQRGPVFGDKLHLPTRVKLDRRLLTGAALFGAGWGLAGFCPGPAIVGLSTGMIEPSIFMLALIAGAVLQGLVADS